MPQKPLGRLRLGVNIDHVATIRNARLRLASIICSNFDARSFSVMSICAQPYFYLRNGNETRVSWFGSVDSPKKVRHTG